MLLVAHPLLTRAIAELAEREGIELVAKRLILGGRRGGLGRCLRLVLGDHKRDERLEGGGLLICVGLRSGG